MKFLTIFLIAGMFSVLSAGLAIAKTPDIKIKSNIAQEKSVKQSHSCLSMPHGFSKAKTPSQKVGSKRFHWELPDVFGFHQNHALAIYLMESSLLWLITIVQLTRLLICQKNSLAKSGLFLSALAVLYGLSCEHNLLLWLLIGAAPIAYLVVDLHLRPLALDRGSK